MLDIMMIYVLPLWKHLLSSIALTWYVCRFGVGRIRPRWISVAGFCFVWTAVEDTVHYFDVDFFWSLARDAGQLILLPFLIGIFFRVAWDKRIFISISYCAVSLAGTYFFIGLKLIFSLFQTKEPTDDELVILSIEQMKRLQWKWLYTEAMKELTITFVCFVLLFLLNRLFRVKEMEFQRGQLLFMAIPFFTGSLFSAFFSEATYGFARSFAMPDSVRSSLNATMSVSMLLLVAILMIEVYVFQKTYILTRERTERMIFEREFSAFREHASELEHMQSSLRNMRHDMHNHAAVLSKLIADGNTGELQAYLTTMTASFGEISGKYATGSVILDALLNTKTKEAEGIKLNAGELIFSKAWGISEYNLCILLGNALDNAIRACSRMQGNNRYIVLKSYVRGRMVFIEIVNSYEGSLLTKPGNAYPCTDKETPEEHGMGFASMQHVADEYHGTLDWKAEDGEFRLTAMLQIAEKDT